MFYRNDAKTAIERSDAHVERTLLSVAFDFVLDLDLDSKPLFPQISTAQPCNI
jgi:hypothetical protein